MVSKKSLFDVHNTTTKLCFQIFQKKNKDYAGDTDAFKNFRLVEVMGVCSVSRGVMVRLCDKFSRISNLLEKEGAVRDESIEDTIHDAINYLIILKAALQEGRPAVNRKSAAARRENIAKGREILGLSDEKSVRTHYTLDKK